MHPTSPQPSFIPFRDPTRTKRFLTFRPDRCDGSYASYCDSTRQYTNITAILKYYGATALLNYMTTYWPSNSGTAESFWEHEWGKHGTCISTLEKKCYPGYQAGSEVVDFFNTTVNLFKTLDSYSVCLSPPFLSSSFPLVLLSSYLPLLTLSISPSPSPFAFPPIPTPNPNPL